jgi:hypothetical protein
VHTHTQQHVYSVGSENMAHANLHKMVDGLRIFLS